MRVIIPVLMALAVSSGTSVSAQSSNGIVVGVGVGGTYYCIITRCNEGSTIGVMTALQATPALTLEAGVRRHYCFDCDRFIIADAALVVQYPGRRIRPFLAGGASYSSDPGFMGDHVGLLGATGAWIWLSDRWGARIELRGRQVGRGDSMGELSLSVAHRFAGARN